MGYRTAAASRSLGCELHLAGGSLLVRRKCLCMCFQGIRLDPEPVQIEGRQKLHGALMSERIDDGPENGQLLGEHLLWLDGCGLTWISNPEHEDRPLPGGQRDGRFQDPWRSLGAILRDF